MKKIILLLMALLTISSHAQNAPAEEDESHNILVSGGLHLGLWTLVLNKKMVAKDLPFNIQIDKVFKKKMAVGLAYSYERYHGSPFFLSGSGTYAERQNICLRLYGFIGGSERKFVTYLGASAGVSYWNAEVSRNSGNNQYWPTAQFLFGMKLKLREAAFWLMEFGAGPPYFCQSSLGLKF